MILDIVPNHTSDRHPWFVDSRSSRAAPRRDWYVWAEGRGDGLPPNNWLSTFGGGPAWTFDERTGQWHLHNFLPAQPDLNWWNDEVRDEFDRILRFWFDRGVAGFRIDVANAIVKDRLLRDDPPEGEDDDARVRAHGLRPVYSLNRPEVHDVFRRWRRIAEEYEPARLLLGETYVLDPVVMASYYGDGDELQLAFNFAFFHSSFQAAALRAVVEASEAAIPPQGRPVWTLSNHDHVRFPTRWCGEDEAKARCAVLALLTLRGTPVLYYGDELGLPETDVPPERILDIDGRDGARTPMPWSAEPGGGFTGAGIDPWLPFGDLPARNVAAQRDDPGSILTLCRHLIQRRRQEPQLLHGAYESLPAPEGVWAWRRGRRFAAAVNLGEHEASVAGLEGTLLVGTRRERDGQRVRSGLRLGASEGALIELDGSPRRRPSSSGPPRR